MGGTPPHCDFAVLPSDPVAPSITSFTAVAGVATIVFDRQMDQTTGLTGAGWSWRKTNQMYLGASATWTNATTLVVTGGPPDADVGSQIYSYSSGSGDVKSLAGVSLASVTNHAY